MKQSSGAPPGRSCSAAMALARAPASCGRSTECTAWAYFHDGFGLVALQLADEMPAELHPAQRGGLLRGFLVAVLSDVGDAERGEPPDVLCGVEFGDHNKLRRPILPAGRLDCTVDALPDGVEPSAELFQPGVGRPGGGLVFSHPLIHSIAPVALRVPAGVPASVHTSPANRPVFGSRR